MLFRSLSLLPDPVLFPGNMTFGFEVRTSVPLNDPQKVSLEVGRVVEVLEGSGMGQLAGPLRDVCSGDRE